MKLYMTGTSPFARKCRITARVKGVALEEIAADPYANAPELMACNPIVQVPSLVAEDGLPINDSQAICEYLDAVGTGPRLLPADGPARLRVRRLETHGNAALEMGVKLLLELRRPDGERSPTWIARWTTHLGRALDALEAARPDAAALDMGVITAGVALDWIDFRHPDYDWKTGRPNLVALQAALEALPSFADTRPS